MNSSAPEGDGPIGHTRKAYLGIRQMMFHNEIVPGQKISYRELAERLKMSQTPVIQALKWLEFQQLVRHEPNRGYFTAPISVQEVEEIYDLRQMIELDLLSVSILRIDESKLASLRSALNAHAEVARGVYIYDRLIKDMEFHLTLASLSGRGVHYRMLSNLFDLLYLKYGASILFSTSVESAGLEHRELFDRIVERDAKKAKTVLSRHLRSIRRHVLESLNKIEQARRWM